MTKFKHKKTGDIYFVRQQIVNKTTNEIGVLYHRNGSNYYREKKDFFDNFERVVTVSAANRGS